MSKATSWETTESPVIKMSFEDKAMILVDEGGDDLVPKYHVAKLSIVGMTASADGALVSPVIAIRNAVTGFTSGTLDMTVIPSVN